MNRALNKIFLLILILKISIVFAQKKEAFNLLFTNTDAFYFNAIIYKGDVLFGTDIGVISFKNRIPFIADNNIKGPIGMINDGIVK